MRAGNVHQAAGNTRTLNLIQYVVYTLLLVLSAEVAAQQPGKIPHIAYISGSDAAGAARGVKAFRQGMRELGYAEGKNILIDYRYGDGNLARLFGIVSEVIRLRVDAVVSSSFSAIKAAKEATEIIPIVMVTTEDPVTTGLINSLARPGGNITGVSRLTTELGEKRLELFKDIVPTMTRVALLFSDNRTRETDVKKYEIAARSLKLELQPFLVQGPKPDLKSAFQSAIRESVNAVLTGRGPVLNNYRKDIAGLAIHYHLPLMSEGADYAESGALASYSGNEDENFRNAATYVDKILKGAKPADLPVEQPTKFELVINLKTAKQIGLGIPPNMLARADKVIR